MEQCLARNGRTMRQLTHSWPHCPAASAGLSSTADPLPPPLLPRSPCCLPLPLSHRCIWMVLLLLPGVELPPPPPLLPPPAERPLRLSGM